MGFGVLDYLYLGILGNHNFDGNMVPTGKEVHNGHNADIHITFSTSTSRKGLPGESDPQGGNRNINTTFPGGLKNAKIGSAGQFPSPSGKFRRIADERDEILESLSPSTEQGLPICLNMPFSRKVDWASLLKTGKGWIRNPLNMALLLWISCVAVSGAILFMVMTGMLNRVLPKKSQRNVWFEVNNQILNALFTLLCLYQHPKRFHHLVLLCRWKPKDISHLRGAYCKNGTIKPHEWTHMMVVIVLLHVNCFAQYVLCGLNLGYKQSERPAIGVGVSISIAIAAPALAGLYSILSPLGRDYDLEVDEEAQNKKVKSVERRLSFASRKDQTVIEVRPTWRGRVFDFWEDTSLAYLSIFCCFCVFGWNMERLGFGNMYVHIATFLLFCMAPFWIFNLAAVNIDNETVREAMGITGIVLCVFGLLYGGFWRIQMRKRFNLPENNMCCGKPAIADCAQWLFCCWCSLVQEVRTADFYDIVEDKFCRKLRDDSGQPPLYPLPRENGLFQLKSDSSPPNWNSPILPKQKTYSQGPRRFSRNNQVDRELPETVGDFFDKEMEDIMKPPVPPFIWREDTFN
ncbi:hypothetical protein NMG60_11000103 [Bertholletia excelsa]